MRFACALFIVFLLSNTPSPLYPVWQLQMGYSAATTTLLFAAYQVGVLCGLLGLARPAERRWPRWSLPVTIGIAIASAVLLALAALPWQLGLARFLSGIASGIFVSYGAATVTAQYTARGRTNGHWVASLCITAGLGLGPLTGGAFIDLVANPEVSVFAAEAALLLAAGLAVLLRPAVPAAQQERPAAGLETVAVQPRTCRARLRSSRQRPPQLRLALAVIITCGIICSVHMSVGSVYLALELGVRTGLAAGGMVAMVFAAGFLGQIVLGRSSVQAKSYWSLALGLAGAAVLGYGMLTASVPALFASAVLSGGCQGAGQLAAMSIAREFLGEEALAQGFARINFFGYAAGMATVLATGALVPALGLGAAIALVCVLALALTVGAGILLTVRKGLLEPLPAAVRYMPSPVRS
ncbi:MFS transporter [Arthrobacter sp. GCM10027362]|uniref:MFS transporter n=1 Tax=Arthrobacter sp. GCM10027362 TaxID=3273379 RepID=UPI0036312C75